MSHRERILSVIRGEQTDRVPFDIWYTPEVRDQLIELCGVSSEPEMWGSLDIDKIVMLETPYADMDSGNGSGSGQNEEAEKGEKAEKAEEAEEAEKAEKGERTLEWGHRVRDVANDAGAVYEETVYYPMKDISTVEEVHAYPWPDASQYRYDVLQERCEYYAPWTRMLTFISIFEIYCKLRPMDQALMDLYIEQDLARAVISHILEIQKEYIKRAFAACGDAIDIVYLSDDMGMQDRQMISTEKWEEMFAGPYKELIDLVHSLGAYVFYHTDGAAFPVIQRMVEQGVDIINPIQHTCPGMDREHLIESLEDSVVFHGAVENQQVLPFGTAEDVRKEVAEDIRVLGRCGKYICGPCHNLQPGTPTENILALYHSDRNWRIDD
ncbi:MAG: hypothetical protein K9L75_03190 [Spirochaetia bacterium]|nr:hypothetical protein [Spirochaetia bacterium]